MKKILICIAFLLCAFHLPVSAEGLRGNEIINIGVIVNNDNSFEIIASTTKKTIGPTRAFLVFEEDDDPEQASAILTITTIGSAQTIHEKWSGGTPLFSNERFYEYTDENGMLKPGRYFAVVTEYEGNGDILTDRAYFTIPAIEQWWTPQPTLAPTPTPTEEPTPGCNSQAYVRKDRTTGSHRFACAESFFGHWNDPYRCLCYPGRNHLRRACGDLLFGKEEKVDF